jgi:hypothetical protein
MIGAEPGETGHSQSIPKITVSPYNPYQKRKRRCGHVQVTEMTSFRKALPKISIIPYKTLELARNL